MKYVRALAACFGIFLAYTVIAVIMEWKHGGGFIPLLIFFAALSGTWRALTKDDEGKKAALKVATPEVSSSESAAPNRDKESEQDKAPADGAFTIKLFCPRCGIQNQSNAKFCWKCGHAMHQNQDPG